MTAQLQEKEQELAQTKAALEKAEQDKNSTVEELKSLRQKNQEIEGERDALKIKVNQTQTNDPEEVVRKVLAERDEASRKQSREARLEAFKEANKHIFAESNDPGGIKLQAFNRRLSRYNLDAVTSEADLTEVFEEALVGAVGKTVDIKSVFIDPSISTSPKSPAGPTGTGLSSQEQTLIKQVGWTEERYLKLKKSRPDYIRSLLSNLN